MTATKFLIPFLMGSKPFPYEQIGGLDGQAQNFLPLLFQANEKSADPVIVKSLAYFRNNYGGDLVLDLLYFTR